MTNPRVEKFLAEGVGDFDPAGYYGASVAHTVHSVFAWDAGDNAYAVLVDNEDFEDVDIMDISNPRAPKLVAEYDLKERFPQIYQEGHQVHGGRLALPLQSLQRWRYLCSRR